MATVDTMSQEYGTRFMDEPYYRISQIWFEQEKIRSGELFYGFSYKRVGNILHKIDWKSAIVVFADRNRPRTVVHG